MNSAAAYIPVFHDPSDKSHDGAVAILADVIQPTQADTKPLSHEDQLAAEYERGRSEGMHAAEDIAAAELATLKEEQEALLVEVRQSLEQTYAEQLTANLETAFAELEDSLASCLSCLLLAFV